ncbi:hypothetical protein HDZ31DRAFT_12773, partial [Schizophyllum fasciatum]
MTPLRKSSSAMSIDEEPPASNMAGANLPAAPTIALSPSPTTASAMSIDPVAGRTLSAMSVDGPSFYAPRSDKAAPEHFVAYPTSIARSAAPVQLVAPAVHRPTKPLPRTAHRVPRPAQLAAANFTPAPMDVDHPAIATASAMPPAMHRRSREKQVQPSVPVSPQMRRKLQRDRTEEDLQA